MSTQKLWERYIAMVEEVNNAKTEVEHRRLDCYLFGFHEATIIMGYHFGSEADWYYMNKGVERDMCCGVFLDWKSE